MSSPTENEEDRQLNRWGCSGRVREKGEIWGVVHIKSIGHDSVLVFEIYVPSRACLLNSSISCIIRILAYPDRNLGSASIRIKGARDLRF